MEVGSKETRTVVQEKVTEVRTRVQTVLMQVCVV